MLLLFNVKSAIYKKKKKSQFYCLYLKIQPQESDPEFALGYGTNGTSVYEAPWNRFQPYLVGILLGYILHLTRGQKIHINPKLNVLCWQAAFLTAFGVVYGTYSHYERGRLTQLENVLYNGFQRIGWSLSTIASSQAKLLLKMLSGTNVFSPQMKLLWKIISGTIPSLHLRRNYCWRCFQVQMSSHLRWNYCGRCYNVLMSGIVSFYMKLLWKMLLVTNI